MTAAADLTGIRFGKLVALHRVAGLNGHARWMLKCECGNSHLATNTSLKCGNVTHCGCSPASRTHGLSHTPLFRRWSAMRERCANPKNQQFKSYGGRGIKVCPEWDCFETFAKWALLHGYDERLELDRIDNDKGYCPDNCRYVTRQQNSLNMRKTVRLLYDGEMLTLFEISRRCGLSAKTIRTRLNLGFSLEEATTWEANAWLSRRRRSCAASV